MDWYLRRIATLDSLEYACHWEKDYLQTNVEAAEGAISLCRFQKCHKPDQGYRTKDSLSAKTG
jgi:hypothetical protein